MRIRPFLLLLGSYLLYSHINDAAAFSNREIKVITVRGSAFACNRGSDDGIETGMQFLILQEGRIIGSAEVFTVRNRICGLRIIKIVPGHIVRVGDTLTTSEKAGGDTLQNPTRPLDQRPLKDIISGNDISFSQGVLAARSCYDGGNALIGGMVTGTLIGPLGWVMVSPVICGRPAVAPVSADLNLKPEQRALFISGYQEWVAKTRKRNFNKGVLFGTLVSIAAYVHFLNAK
jgi:hypothetical protein